MCLAATTFCNGFELFLDNSSLNDLTNFWVFLAYSFSISDCFFKKVCKLSKNATNKKEKKVKKSIMKVNLHVLRISLRYPIDP